MQSNPIWGGVGATRCFWVGVLQRYGCEQHGPHETHAKTKPEPASSSIPIICHLTLVSSATSLEAHPAPALLSFALIFPTINRKLAFIEKDS